MLPNQPLHLRCALSTLKITPSSLRPCCIAVSAKSPRPRFPSSPNHRNFSSASKTLPCTFTGAKPASRQLFLRCSSTSSATTSPSAAPATPTVTSLPPNPPTTLPWNQYLQLRRTRRYYNLAASASTSIGTTAAGISIISQQNLELLGNGLFGLDPFIMLGLATAGSGAVGWLLGPFVGNAVFGIVYRKVSGQIAAKDKDFYRRIKQYRVDPSSQSYSNPVPDYYGEKIGSVAEFRNWMKDQRAYNKKRQNFL